MSGSFERIDYSVRPAKYAERRMLRDVLRKVTYFAPPEAYRYVGFGSVWFADFILFHRALGIRDMVSIESKKSAQARVQANAPFNIKLVFQRSGPALRALDWKSHQFIWLDYDDAIDNEKLADATLVATRAQSGTILAVTFRAAQAKEYDSHGKTVGAAENAFRSTFAASLYPDNIADDDLTGYPFAKLSRSMLLTAIEASLDARGGPVADRMRFRTICSIDYADGVLMTTLVGMFHLESDTHKVDACGFADLDFVTDPHSPVRIELPLLTPREMRAVEAQLPLEPGGSIDHGTSPLVHALRLEKFYRYLPNYMVAEM